MKKIFITIIAASFVVGCSGLGSLGNSAGSSAGSSGRSSGGSSAGSSGGFFKKREKEVQLEQRIPAAETRILIPVVTEVQVDAFRGGVLIKAKGTLDRQGYSNVNLVAVNKGLPDENGVVTYEFKGEKPKYTRAGPTPRSNEVYAGAFITSIRLASVKRIRVVAAQNQIVKSK
ncbi:MAG: hypothetical protein JKX71_01530 [Amylibacter sp.]|nr:hypothetical protein [Amylibacter sp.]